MIWKNIVKKLFDWYVRKYVIGNVVLRIGGKNSPPIKAYLINEDLGVQIAWRTKKKWREFNLTPNNKNMSDKKQPYAQKRKGTTIPGILDSHRKKIKFFGK